MNLHSGARIWAANAAEAILLVGHGSKDPEGERQYREFAANLERRLGVPVQPAFLEFNDPPIAEAVQRCIERGVRRITVMPLFLGAATHQKNDVPTAITWARQHFPDVAIVYGTPLGTHAALAEAAGACAIETLAGCSKARDGDTALLLVGRGSRDPDSNSDLYKIGRLIYESGRFEAVEACFIAVCTPDLPAGVERCARLGARRIVAVPYMLFEGVLVKRVAQVLQDLAPAYAGVRLLATPPLGSQPQVLAVVEQRIADAIAGEAHANCDACKYRVRMTGFEAELGLPQGSDHHHGLRGAS